jgi:tRNA 2-thiouridine synthesizing protein A
VEAPDPEPAYRAGMTDPNPSQEFLERLAARDFEGLASLLAPGAAARLLLPRGPEEHRGPQLARRLEDWFGGASEFEVLVMGAETVGSRQRLSWRFRLVRGGGPREVIEQVAFLDQGPAGIERIDLLCSGFMPDEEAATASPSSQVFDAGTLGCADGLAEEFRRRIADVPVGGLLAVVVRDPAAKEDLPSLARLLGLHVAATETYPDGRLTITVERRR